MLPIVRTGTWRDRGEGAASPFGAAASCWTSAYWGCTSRRLKLTESTPGGAIFHQIGLGRAFRHAPAAHFHPLRGKPQLDLPGQVTPGWDVHN